MEGAAAREGAPGTQKSTCDVMDKVTDERVGQRVEIIDGIGHHRRKLILS